MAKKKQTQRRMPQQIVSFFLEDDWEGWEFDADTYLPQGKWLEPIVEWEEQLAVLRGEVERLQEAHKSKKVSDEEANNRVTGLVSRQTIILTKSRLHAKRLLQDVVTKWNFVDREGGQIPLTKEGWDSLPRQLIEACWFKYFEYISEPPKAGSEG